MRRYQLKQANSVRISILGTNDVHGHLEHLGRFAGFVENLRKARRADGGAVLLLDAGDMFQGTLESNLVEGASMVRAYNAMRYDAVAIGNHEFDFGPVGPKSSVSKSATGPAADPFGALLQRAKEARFPMLAANIKPKRGDKSFGYPIVKPSVILEKAGFKVGVIGVSTEDTLEVTLRSNVETLAMLPLAQTVKKEAKSLRKKGAQVIVVLAHAGGKCGSYHGGGENLRSCEKRSEIFRLARALPSNLVDAVVAGHTHQMIAHKVNGIPMIESRSHGRMFGRIDLWIEKGAKHASRSVIHAPRGVCKKGRGGTCEKTEYEGAPVRLEPTVEGIVEEAIASAESIRDEKLGVNLADTFRRSRVRESALCNFFASLTKETVAGADVGLANAGGIRSNLSAGPLRYGAFFEAYPFDNRVAVVALPVPSFKALLRRSLRGRGGILCFAGVRVEAQCNGTKDIEIVLRNEQGQELGENKVLRVATHEFLSTGAIADVLGSASDSATKVQEQNLREAMAQKLREGHFGKKGRSLASKDFYNAEKPRFAYPGKRPVRCR